MTRSQASREEWLLLYSKGLDVKDIARICRTLPWTAEAYIRDQLARDPPLFDRRLGRCVEPSLPVFRDGDAARGWDGNLLSLSGSLNPGPYFPGVQRTRPRQLGRWRCYYHWVREQRSRSAAGQLTTRQESRLDALLRWTAVGRDQDQLHTRHWGERLAARKAFVEERGHLPRYKWGDHRTGGHPCARG